MSNDRPVIRDRFWRYLTDFWSLVAYAAIIYDFVTNNGFGQFLPSILVVYIALLTIFVSAKEFERWYELYEGRHPGEWFVIGWTVLIVGIMAAELIFRKPYMLPTEVLSTYIAVLSILAITQRSKSMRRYKK